MLGALWVERRIETTLPTPTGSFAVGRVIDDWTDDETPDTLAPVPGAKRELLVWILYPSAAGQSVAIDDYVPAQMLAAAGPARGPLRFVTRGSLKVQRHSTPHSALSPHPPTHP